VDIAELAGTQLLVKLPQEEGPVHTGKLRVFTRVLTLGNIMAASRPPGLYRISRG